MKNQTNAETEKKVAELKSGWIEREKQRVRNIQSAFSSQNAVAVVNLAYHDCQSGEHVEFAFILSGSDPELMQMLNDYGARKSMQFLLPEQKTA